MFFEIEKDESEAAEATVGFAQVCNINEGSLSPDVWQNIICDDDFDDDCFGKVQNDKDPELSQIHEGPLLNDLTVSDEIPDMECFKEISAEHQEETVVDGLLYATSFLELLLKICWTLFIFIAQSLINVSLN